MISGNVPVRYIVVALMLKDEAEVMVGIASFTADENIADWGKVCQVVGIRHQLFILLYAGDVVPDAVIDFTVLSCQVVKLPTKIIFHLQSRDMLVPHFHILRLDEVSHIIGFRIVAQNNVSRFYSSGDP